MLGIFQSYINSILRDQLNKFYSTYFNNILVYSKYKQEYKGQYYYILTYLYKVRLYLNIIKYKFSIKYIKYLKIILTIEGLQIDPNKVKAILN